MGRCRFRPIAYRMGLVFVTLGFILVALGYGFPTWVRRKDRLMQGLWHVCDRQWASCSFLAEGDVTSATAALVPTWLTGVLLVVSGTVFTGRVLLMAVRAVLGACLLTYLFTLGMALRENCCSPNFYTCCLSGRKTEVLAFLAELMGIAGMVLFSIDEYESVGDFNRLSWGHAMCDFGLAVSLIGSIMMACAQQSLPSAKAAAGRIVAKPQGYESLANNRSASIQSRSTHCTQASPFQGRTTPHISGPFPTPEAIAAVNAAVSPKQQRPAVGMNGPTSSHQRKLSSPSPYPVLDSQSSPSKRRKSSGQLRQFAGMHNQNKHPPVFSSQHVQDEWRVQQSATWSENMRVEEEGMRKQRALKSQMEHQQQQLAMQHHANTWSVANERDRAHWAHSVQQVEHHYDRDWRATSQGQQCSGSHPVMPPPPAPPSAVAPVSYPPYSREGYQAFLQTDGRQLYNGYQYPDPSCVPQGGGGGYLDSLTPQHHCHHHHQQQQQQQRPDSGNFPDPPPPEQLLCYEEERPTETLSYHGYPNPIPGAIVSVVPQSVQPVVLYRAPSKPGQSPVTETLAMAIRSPEPYNHPNSRSTLPHGSAFETPPSQHYSPQHKTFPRQQPAHPPASPHCYSTFGR